MATIKSFTSVEQSRKLAEILPIESADMCYQVGEDLDGYLTKTIYTPLMHTPYNDDYIPCWSLAALLGALPNNKPITTTLSRGGWKIEPIEYLDNWWCEYEDESHTKDFSVSANNPVDACVAMIEKLHELNLL